MLRTHPDNSRHRLLRSILFCAAALIAFCSLLYQSSGSAYRKAQGEQELITAVQRHDTTRVRQLLEEGIDPDTTASSPTTPGEAFAVGLRRLRTPKFTLPQHSALVDATRQGYHDIVALLLHHGADPDCWGGSPLLSAAGRGDVETVRLLLAAGADPDASEARGMPVLANCGLHMADSHRSSSEVEACFRMLLVRGAKTNVYSENLGGFTPLQAVGFNANLGTDQRLRLMRLMIRHGADVNIKGRDGHTLLWQLNDWRPYVPHWQDKEARANYYAVRRFLTDAGARAE